MCRKAVAVTLHESKFNPSPRIIANRISAGRRASLITDKMGAVNEAAAEQSCRSTESACFIELSRGRAALVVKGP